MIKWTALVFTIIGALCTALSLDPYNIILLNIGSALYLIWALRAKDYNIALVNATLLAIYLTGAALRLHI
jgi:hypothetical protein